MTKGRQHRLRQEELAGNAGVGLGRVSWRMADGELERRRLEYQARWSLSGKSDERENTGAAVPTHLSSAEERVAQW